MIKNNNFCEQSNKHLFFQGVRDGIPIGLGYFAVSFSLGIIAKKAGLSPFMGFLASLLNNASAGEYAGFTLIAANATLLEVAIMTFIANARYLLMSCALSQKMSPDLSLGHRLLIAFDLTDELFGITIAKPGYLKPLYSYGAFCVAIPCWSIGTACGVIAGDILPASIVSALSVALYGMFLAIIIPPMKKDRPVAVCVLVSILVSYFSQFIPGFNSLSSGMQTIILTLILSSLAAICFPRKEDNPYEN